MDDFWLEQGVPDDFENKKIEATVQSCDIYWLLFFKKQYTCTQKSLRL